MWIFRVICLKKRIIVVPLICLFVYFIYKKVSHIFNLGDDIDVSVFDSIRSRNMIFENWLVYVGSSLIVISLMGIYFTLRASNRKRKSKKRNLKFKKFEDLFS